MPFSQGPYSLHSSLPAPSVTEIHSSRFVNFVTKAYEVDANGNDASQPSIQQIVAMTLAFEVTDPDFITTKDQEQLRKDIVTALLPLSGGSRPSIDRLTVIVASASTGNQKTVVNFRDITTGLDQSVEI